MADGYCEQWGPEKLAEIERGWREQDEPATPAPPMVNVHLAVELSTGLDTVREYEFQGTTYRMRPTPYATAIRLLAWTQQLDRLTAMGQLLGHLPELRLAYEEVLTLVGSLLLDHEGVNPFLDAEKVDVYGLVNFALDAGTDFRLAHDRSGTPPPRSDTAHHLMSFRSAFGKMPDTWREFCAGNAYLRRRRAERVLELYEAAVMGQCPDESVLSRWRATQEREAGQ